MGPSINQSINQMKSESTAAFCLINNINTWMSCSWLTSQNTTPYQRTDTGLHFPACSRSSEGSFPNRTEAMIWENQEAGFTQYTHSTGTQQLIQPVQLWTSSPGDETSNMYVCLKPSPFVLTHWAFNRSSLVNGLQKITWGNSNCPLKEIFLSFKKKKNLEGKKTSDFSSSSEQNF